MVATPPIVGDGFKPRVQGLRAIAVLLVLLFHVWPDLVPGGYVGVDVFFVISGYLITGLLVKEFHATGRINLPRFYGRRIRRLIPAASLVLFVVALSVPLLPPVRWEGTARDIIFSAFNIQNWWLAYQSVDYLASDNPPSILKHFWSLSVEEQFYIVWPLILLAAGYAAKRFSVASGRVLLFVVVAVLALSLLHSALFTRSNPAAAYFATTTRAWELALGGLIFMLALPERTRGFIRELVVIVGLLLVICSALLLDRSTAYPGIIAMLPVLGGTLLIVGSTDQQGRSFGRILEVKPLQYLGDVSYSLYLWHWPVLILYTVLMGRQPDVLGGLAVVGLSCVLAHITKTQVEDRFRGQTRSARWIAAPGILALSLSLAVTSSLLIRQGGGGAAGVGVETSDASLVVDSGYPGAAMLTHGIAPLTTDNYVPSPVHAALDRSDAYGRCIAADGVSELKSCAYGNPEGTYHVLLVGDSHAVHWFPAFDEISKQRGWRMTGLSKSACAFGAQPVKTKFGDEALDCTEWNRLARRWVVDTRPDLVVFAQSIAHNAVGAATKDESAEMIGEGLAQVWRELIDYGIRVVAIKDTPWMGQNVPDCLSRRGAQPSDCNRNRRQAVEFREDPLEVAHHKVRGTVLVDVNNTICDPQSCRSVVGNVLVWKDSHHLTATFARSLAPYLGQVLDQVVARAPSSKVVRAPSRWHELGDHSRAPATVADVKPAGTGEEGTSFLDNLPFGFEHEVQYDRLGKTVQGRPQRQIFVVQQALSESELLAAYKDAMSTAGFRLVSEVKGARGVRTDHLRADAGMISALVRPMPSASGQDPVRGAIYITHILQN